jgi:phosphoribosylglycinamide formyltransferase
MHDLPTTKATVLISGNGSNLQALIDASHTTMPYLKIIRVISNRSKAFGLTRAENASIPTAYHNLISGKYHASGEKDVTVIQKAREKYNADLAQMVIADEPDIVVCAGWMHVFDEHFLDPLAEKNIPVINLHPALFGKYDGKDAIKRAYDDYHKGQLEHNKTGIMVHRVIKDVDRGTPIIQREIECRPTETLDELTNRMHEQEHELILEGTAMAITKLWEERGRTAA